MSMILSIRAVKQSAVRGWLLALSLGIVCALSPTPVLAGHEADHRYTIWGQVNNAAGAPLGGVNVLVTGWGGEPLGEATTEADGGYSVLLHVHNDILGRPFYVSVGDSVEPGEFTFDPGNNRAERKHRLDLVASQ